MSEQEIEKQLHIKTTGEQKWEDHKIIHYHPYQTTPYSALETLFEQYPLTPDNHLIDFGCGKGRLVFYVDYFTKGSATGIEMDAILYQQAENNQQQYLATYPNSKNTVNFIHALAQEYEIQPRDNCFYFFNPFSIQIFQKVINNILKSVEQEERRVDIILYYPSQDYLDYLDNRTPFTFWDEVILSDRYGKDKSERFVIYRLWI